MGIIVHQDYSNSVFSPFPYMYIHNTKLYFFTAQGNIFHRGPAPMHCIALQYVTGYEYFYTTALKRLYANFRDCFAKLLKMYLSEYFCSKRIDFCMLHFAFY